MPSGVACHAVAACGGGRHLSLCLGSTQMNLRPQTSNAQHSTSNIQRKIAGGGARTHTALRPLDFESSASANSATPAILKGTETIRPRRRSSTLPSTLKE